MSEPDWESPDGRIRKFIIKSGEWGLKPTENSLCSIKITECSLGEIQKYEGINSVTIGDSNSYLERCLDKCLFTMHTGEIAKFILLKSQLEEITFTLHLVSITFNGLIYDWNADQKLMLSLKHKDRGNELFNESRFIDASHRFGKALKILCSIPIRADEPPDVIDGVAVEEIKKLKTKLYNNLASCYLKCFDYEIVLSLCKKVLENDGDNIKALYKEGVAKCETHDYDGSRKSLMRVLELKPDNKAAIDKLKYVNTKVVESNVRVNTMIKKMFL